MLGVSRAYPLPASGGPPWPASTQEKLPRLQTATRGAVWGQGGGRGGGLDGDRWPPFAVGGRGQRSPSESVSGRGELRRPGRRGGAVGRAGAVCSL